MNGQAIETEEERVELSKNSCESFTGFEVPSRQWNQQLKGANKALLGPLWHMRSTKCATSIRGASTALQAASESPDKPALRALSNSHSGLFLGGFGWIKPLYIPSLLAGLLLVSGCTQIPCDTLWLSVICGVDPRHDHKYKRVKPSDLVPAKPHKTRR